MSRWVLVVTVWIALACAAWAQAPGFWSTLQTTDTTANSLLVGCAFGSTTCTGGMKAGPLAVSTVTASDTGLTSVNVAGGVEVGGSGVKGEFLARGDGSGSPGRVRLYDMANTLYLGLQQTGTITADRNLNFDVGDASRTITLSGQPTLADWFDQSVKAAASPTHNNLTLTGDMTVNQAVFDLLNSMAGGDISIVTDDVLYLESTTGGVTISTVDTAEAITMVRGGSTSISFRVGPNNSNMFEVLGRTGATSTDIGSHVTVQRSTGTNAAPGMIGLQEADASATNYLWYDNSALLRTGAPPEADGTPSVASGTVVGDQTSDEAFKNILDVWSDDEASLALINKTPILRFTYRDGRYHGEEFLGISTTRSPEFGKDQNRAFNELTANGHLMSSVKALTARLTDLEARVQTLEAQIGALVP